MCNSEGPKTALNTKQLEKIVNKLGIKDASFQVLVRKNWSAYVTITSNSTSYLVIKEEQLDNLKSKLGRKGYKLFSTTIVFDSDKKNSIPKIEYRFDMTGIV